MAKKLLRLVFASAMLWATVPAPAAPPAPAANNSWTGRFVVVKKSSIKLTLPNNGQTVEVGPLDKVLYPVLDDQGGRLLINDGRGHTGWFDKADAVPVEEAAAWLTERIQANPKDVGALNDRALVWRHLGDLDKALADFDEAIRLSPVAALYNNRGGIWASKKQFDKALADFTEAIKLHEHTVFYANRGVAWRQLKEYDKALADFNDSLRLDARNVAAYNERGLVWALKKDFDKAIVDYGDALRLDPVFAPAYLNRGVAWNDKKEYDKAIEDLTTVLQLQPRSTLALVQRARARDAKKDYALALADLNEAFRIDSHFGPILNDLAWLLATCPDDKIRDGPKAVTLAEEAVKLSPKNLSFLDTLAAAHAEAGNFAEAARLQEQVLADPQLRDNPEFRRRLELYKLGQSYHKE